MKKAFALFLVLASGVFLSGCTRNNVDLERETNNDVEDVVVIDDENEVDEDTEDVDDEEEVEEEEVQKPEPKEDEDRSTTEPVAPGTKTVGTALAADGAALTAYSYGMVNRKLEFSWKVRGSAEKPYPKATAKLDNNNVVVEFESLQGDYVGKEDGSMQLGNNLPNLSWVKTTNGTKYTFEFQSAKNFELVAQEVDDKGTHIILRIDL